MRWEFLAFALMTSAFAMQPMAGLAQQSDVPGGATGANVFCIQAGDLNTGAFVGTFLQTGAGWEERLKAGTFKLQESKRDELAVELNDSARSASVQFDFVNKMIKFKPSNAQAWRDRYHILNATDRAASTDCAMLASASAGGAGGPGAGPGGSGGGAGAGPGRGGGGGGGGGARPQPTNPVIVIQIPPKSVLDIPPGTRLTAVQGPPCPGHPGHFLCPNKFSCAPIGGVCCPGVGACAQGTFCDAFIVGHCVGPQEARFCQGTGNMATGASLHCEPGKTCLPNRKCR